MVPKSSMRVLDEVVILRDCMMLSVILGQHDDCLSRQPATEEMMVLETIMKVFTTILVIIL